MKVHKKMWGCKPCIIFQSSLAQYRTHSSTYKLLIPLACQQIVP